MANLLVRSPQAHKGLLEIEDVLQQTRDVFRSIEAVHGDQLVKHADSLEISVRELTKSCEAQVMLLGTSGLVAQYTSRIEEASSVWQGTSAKLAEIDADLDIRGPRLLDLCLLVVTAMIGICGLLGLATRCCKSSRCICFVVSFILLVLIAIFILIGVELAASVAFADFCERPEVNSIKTAEAVKIAPENMALVKYFVNCSGVHPLQEDLSGALMAIHDLVRRGTCAAAAG
jgi:hypothetical protein